MRAKSAAGFAVGDRVELMAEDDPDRGARGDVDEIDVTRATKEVSIYVIWDKMDGERNYGVWEHPENLRVLQLWEVAEERGQQRLFGLGRRRRRR